MLSFARHNREEQVIRSILSIIQLTESMMVLQLPSTFVKSIEDFALYPENLVHQTTYHSVLKAYKSQLDDKEKTIFTNKDLNINVPFRDLINSSIGTSIDVPRQFCHQTHPFQVSRRSKYKMIASSKNASETHGRWSQLEPLHIRTRLVASCMHSNSIRYGRGWRLIPIDFCTGNTPNLS